MRRLIISALRFNSTTDGKPITHICPPTIGFHIRLLFITKQSKLFPPERWLGFSLSLTQNALTPFHDSYLGNGLLPLFLVLISWHHVECLFGFSSGEEADGSPNHQARAEQKACLGITCAVLSALMVRMQRRSKELTLTARATWLPVRVVVFSRRFGGETDWGEVGKSSKLRLAWRTDTLLPRSSTVALAVVLPAMSLRPHAPFRASFSRLWDTP